MDRGAMRWVRKDEGPDRYRLLNLEQATMVEVWDERGPGKVGARIRFVNDRYVEVHSEGARRLLAHLGDVELGGAPSL